MREFLRVLCIGAFAASAVAGVMRSSDLDDVERRIRSGSSGSTRLLNPSSFNVAPKLSIGTAAVREFGGSASTAGAPVAAWGQIVSAADAARAQQAAASVNYAPGIRSMMVSWAGYITADAPANPGGNDSGRPSTDNAGGNTNTGGGSNTGGNSGGTQQPSNDGGSNTGGSNTGGSNNTPPPPPPTAPNPPPNDAENPPSDDPIPTDPVGDGEDTPSDGNPIPPVGGGNDNDPLPPIGPTMPPGGAIPSPDAGLLALAGMGVLTAIRRRI